MNLGAPRGRRWLRSAGGLARGGEELRPAGLGLRRRRRRRRASAPRGVERVQQAGGLFRGYLAGGQKVEYAVAIVTHDGLLLAV